MRYYVRDSCVQALERYVVVESPNNISGSLTRVLEVHQCNVGYLGTELTATCEYELNRELYLSTTLVSEHIIICVV